MSEARQHHKRQQLRHVTGKSRKVISLNAIASWLATQLRGIVPFKLPLSTCGAPSINHGFLLMAAGFIVHLPPKREEGRVMRLSKCLAVRETGKTRKLSMSDFIRQVGIAKHFNSFIARTLASVFFFSSLAIVAAPLVSANTMTNGETRTISLYHNRTGESLTVTYVKNGKYVPSAMKQIDYLLRDWRRNEVINIDPRTIDLVWELHEDLGSKLPIKIVCGYRSGKTNALLRRIGRKVAEKSQHIRGKAIDFYFADVPTIRVRNSALARKFGGVGYYTGPAGFLHVDSGNIRQWGPRISDTQMAQIMNEGARTIGRHSRPGSESQLASVSVDLATSKTGGLPAVIQKRSAPVKPTAEVATLSEADQDLADLSADAAVGSIKPIGNIKPKPGSDPNVNDEQMAMLSDLTKAVSKEPRSRQVAHPNTPAKLDNKATYLSVAAGMPIPRPRLKPASIALQVAASSNADSKLVLVIAANAPPPSQVAQEPLDQKSLSTVVAEVDLRSQAKPNTKTSTTKSKGNFVTEVRNGTAIGAPLIKSVLASAGGSNINWWPLFFRDASALARRDGAPPLIGADDASTPLIASTHGASSDGVTVDQEPADGKGDLLVVNREGKGDLDLISAQ
jgi:uncharacterized protein YcbK (DUF882 family)